MWPKLALNLLCSEDDLELPIASKCFDYRTGPPCLVLWVPKDQTKDFVCAKQTFYRIIAQAPGVCCVVVCWFAFEPGSHIIVNNGLLYSQTTLEAVAILQPPPNGSDYRRASL